MRLPHAGHRLNSQHFDWPDGGSADEAVVDLARRCFAFSGPYLGFVACRFLLLSGERRTEPVQPEPNLVMAVIDMRKARDTRSPTGRCGLIIASSPRSWERWFGRRGSTPPRSDPTIFRFGSRCPCDGRDMGAAPVTVLLSSRHHAFKNTPYHGAVHTCASPKSKHFLDP
jgi:hypothetical protein